MEYDVSLLLFSLCIANVIRYLISFFRSYIINLYIYCLLLFYLDIFACFSLSFLPFYKIISLCNIIWEKLMVQEWHLKGLFLFCGVNSLTKSKNSQCILTSSQLYICFGTFDSTISLYNISWLIFYQNKTSNFLFFIFYGIVKSSDEVFLLISSIRLLLIKK